MWINYYKQDYELSNSKNLISLVQIYFISFLNNSMSYNINLNLILVGWAFEMELLI
jgi:hypothetical protein